MSQLRINHRNCMPERVEYPASHDLMNWFWNDFDPIYNNHSAPLANIVETKQDFRIELSVPGFSKNDFKIKLDGQVLNISGEDEVTNDNKEENYVRREFSHTAFSRSFQLSDWVDANNISAKYENGMLLVTIPKVEEAKSNPAKEIEIQ